MASVFVSYSRRSGDAIHTLIGDLEGLGHSVWFDRNLSGGHKWWRDILRKIRELDLFVFVMDKDSLESEACRSEYRYAASLGKRVLPILLSDTVSVNLLPPELSEIQFVDYRAPDRDAAIRLARALADLPPLAELPNPLPPEPAAPSTYLGNLASRVDTPDTLSYEQQSTLLFELSLNLRGPATASDARTLLARFRKRADLYAKIDQEISRLVPTNGESPSPADSTTAPLPRGGPSGGPRASPAKPAASAAARRAAGAMGLALGATLGAVSLATIRYFSWPMLFWSLLPALAAASVGAVSAGRPRLGLISAGGAAIGWLVVGTVSNSDPLATGAVFGAPVGALFGMVVGLLLRTRFASV